MDYQNPGNSPRPGLEDVERQSVSKEQAAQSVCSYIVQNEMKSVLGWMTADTA